MLLDCALRYFVHPVPCTLVGTRFCQCR